jgi:hypothetical protein
MNFLQIPAKSLETKLLTHASAVFAAAMDLRRLSLPLS